MLITGELARLNLLRILTELRYEILRGKSHCVTPIVRPARIEARLTDDTDDTYVKTEIAFASYSRIVLT